MAEQIPGAAAPDDVPAPVAPAVVAVVVAREPGPWFEEALGALSAQDYPNLSILVIDPASSDEIKPRVGLAAPGAFVRRLSENPGFGAAANEVLEVVEGAAFYLLCHDDVAPGPDVVRLLVEEAFRSNAGLVGPKLVSWSDPKRLLQVGEGLDHVGYSTPLVERGELDQEQHDSVRDVFVVPGAMTLVRADLFEAIGGFDEGIDYLLDDLSLCWRTHLAGARVIVAPQARVRHIEALGERRPVDDRRRLQTRHRLRVVLSCYSALGLVRAVPKLVILHALEILYSLIVGRTAQARDIVSAWFWNLRRLPDLRVARSQVKSFRRVPDREIRQLMEPGSTRLRQFLRGQIGSGEDRLSGLTRSSRGGWEAMRSGNLRFAAAVWGGVALVLVAGSRHLITRGLPAIGEMVPFSTSSVDLIRTWVSGWSTAGLGSESPNPTAMGIVGGLGILFGGAMGLLRTVLVVGLLPLGALFAYRLAGPTGSRYAQLAALLLYVCNPLPYNALATGRWVALGLYAAVPVVVAMLARASRLSPFGAVDGKPGPGVRPRRLFHEVLGLGFVVALVAALAPVAVLVVPLIAVSLALGSLLTYRTRGSGRMVLVGLGGAAVAVALHLPWSFDFLLPGTPLTAVTGAEPATSVPDLAALMRFDVGPASEGALGWALLVAAALPLLIGRDQRFAWAVRGWTMATVFWGLAWLAQRGDLPFALPPVDVLLAPSAIGLALAAAMGVAAFEVDLPGYRFGWRQVASGLAAAAVIVATIPVMGASFDGRWSMPGGDHSRALGFMDAENDERPFRVLWVGDPAALPLGSWELDEGLAYGTTSGGNPRLEDLWVGSDDGRTGLLADALSLARDGQTARLGQLLSPMGVRYVVVPEQLAPAPFQNHRIAPAPGLAARLDAQLDLEPLDVPAGLRVYRNEAFTPPLAAVSVDAEIPDSADPAAALGADLSGATAVLEDADGHLRWSGPLAEATTVLVSQAHSERWQLTVDGEAVEHSKAFGWANGFTVAEAGEGQLSFRTPLFRYLAVLIQVLAWLWVARTLVRARFNPAATDGSAP